MISIYVLRSLWFEHKLYFPPTLSTIPLLSLVLFQPPQSPISPLPPLTSVHAIKTLQRQLGVEWVKQHLRRWKESILVKRTSKYKKMPETYVSLLGACTFCEIQHNSNYEHYRALNITSKSRFANFLFTLTTNLSIQSSYGHSTIKTRFGHKIASSNCTQTTTKHLVEKQFYRLKFGKFIKHCQSV